MTSVQSENELGPWNPGIASALPHEFLPLSTLFRPGNTSSNLAQLLELSDFSGIPPHDLTAFKPIRLAMHEVLIRVMADLCVPDGSKYEDLGTNFRQMTATILSKYVLPRSDEIERLYSDLKRDISSLISQELADSFPKPAQPSAPAKRNWLAGSFGPKPKAATASPETAEERDLRILAAWKEKASGAGTTIEQAALSALARAASAVIRKKGRLVSDPVLLSALALPLACNDYGAQAIGRHIEPYFQSAVSGEGYSLLPPQERPVVMNVKGASASGKSSMRPLQKELARRLGIRWEDFALISPDIWRKFLLDYNSLGPARRYAGTLTGHEVAIIDKKLDGYMANKGEQGRMSHLLIDRFRFDSFASGPDKLDGSGLLTRFGHRVYMFFMITPPEATVERAWKRGEQFGRYKAVDDLLYHNVEAYTGMPRLFFIWSGKDSKEVYFEFLDNSVPEGSRPRTVAFGKNGEMNILDVTRLLDVERFKKISLSARRPEDLYTEECVAPAKNTGFLRQCARHIPLINFVHSGSGQIYAKVRDGKLMRSPPEPGDQDAKAGLDAVGDELGGGCIHIEEGFGTLARADAFTLGEWGECPLEGASS